MMAHVIVLDSVNEDIFVCGLCKTVFHSLQIFLDHKSFKCSFDALEKNLLPTSSGITDTVIVNDASMSQHSKKLPADVTTKFTTQLKDHVCQVCKKQFKNMKSLYSHMKIHNDKCFQCLVCGRCFNQNSHLQRHISTHKVWPDGLTQTTAKSIKAGLLSYSCPYCDTVFCSYSQYRPHLKNHLALKRFKCIQQDCIEFYDSVESLLQHVNDSHENSNYICYICSLPFNSLDAIASHQDDHNKTSETLPKNVPLHKCLQCDAEFRKSEKLALHMHTESHRKVCIHCGKTFASDKRLRLHLRIHSNFKPFQCNICNNSFPLKKYLSAHMLKHGTRQFKCSICKYTFKRSDLLQRHMRLHQPKKLFKCPFKDLLHCKREFSRSDKLKSHIKTHTKYVSMKTSQKPNLSSQIIAGEINDDEQI